MKPTTLEVLPQSRLRSVLNATTLGFAMLVMIVVTVIALGVGYTTFRLYLIPYKFSLLMLAVSSVGCRV